MRRRTKYYPVTVQDALTFYLEDIESLYEVLRAATDDVVLETENYVLDSPEELQNLGSETLESLEIRGKLEGTLRDIEVDISSRVTILRSSTNEPENVGVITQLNQIIEQVERPRWLNFIHSLRVTLYNAVGIVVLVILASAISAIGSELALTAAILLIIFLILSVARIFYSHAIAPHNQIRLIYSNEAEQPLIKRYGGWILVVVVTAILTTIANLGVQRLWERFFSSGTP